VIETVDEFGRKFVQFLRLKWEHHYYAPGEDGCRDAEEWYSPGFMDMTVTPCAGGWQVFYGAGFDDNPFPELVDAVAEAERFIFAVVRAQVEALGGWNVVLEVTGS
jgi:hypothetical protein